MTLPSEKSDIKRMAYGYKDIDYFRLKIHQHCGLLNPRLNTINAT